MAREARDGRLLVSGPADDDEAYRQALIEWLRRRARSTLGPRLEELARLHALAFERVSVRHQRTRWGSCSPRGAISLNLRLLFLEPALVDHVLIHELCHTRELNHSKRFWALLQAHDPEWALHRQPDPRRLEVAALLDRRQERGVAPLILRLPRWMAGPRPPFAIPWSSL